MVIVQPKWLTQPRSRQASAGPSDMSTPKTTGSGCTDCSSRVSELQDQVEALSKELAESKERQKGMGKEIDALKELFEDMRSAVFPTQSTGSAIPIASSLQGISGNILASHTPSIPHTSPASPTAPVLGDTPTPAAGENTTATPPSVPPSQNAANIEAPADIDEPTDVEGPACIEVPTVFPAPADIEASAGVETPADNEAPADSVAPADSAAPGKMEIDGEYLIYRCIFFILMMHGVVAANCGSQSSSGAALPMGSPNVPSIIISPAEIDSVAAALGLSNFIPVEPNSPADILTSACEVPVPMATQEAERGDIDIQGSGAMDTA